MSADKCSECGSPLMPEDEFCKGCDDALLIPLVPDISEDLTEPDSDSLPVNEEPVQAEENETHRNKDFNKRRLVAVASIFIGILVIGALFSFTDIISRNSASGSPDEDADIPDYSNRFTIDRAIIDGFTYGDLILENPEGIVIGTPVEIIPNKHEINSNNLLELRNVLNKYFEETGLQACYAFLDERGLVINLQSSEIFDHGSNSISKGGANILEYINRQLSYYSLDSIIIEHHTDILEYIVNFFDFLHHTDPYYSRSRNFLPVLFSSLDIGTTVFEYTSFGPANPIATNSTEEGRLLNNRLEIVIKHDFDITFLDIHSENPRESVPGFNTQVETVISKLIGFWQAEWVDRNGDEYFWEIKFADNHEFSMRQGVKDSKWVEEFSGRYSLDLFSDKIMFNSHDYLEYSELGIFFFIRDNLLLFFEGVEPIVLSKAESLDS